MRVALTGATGFLGRYLLRELVAGGHTCRAWYRPASDRSGLDDLPAGQVEWVPGDLADPAAGAALVPGCDAVVHSALQWLRSNGQRGDDDVLHFVERNVLGTLRLIEAARAAGVPRFIFISTCAVHERILADRPLDEAHPLWPTGHYGAHKAALEKFVHSYGFGQGYDICSLRPTGIYGLAHPVEQSRWFDLVRSVVRGERVVCERGGKEVHAADVARAVSILLTATGIAGEAYNCYDRYVSAFEVAQLANELSGGRATLEGRQTHPQHQIDTGKLRALGVTFGGTDRLRATVAELVAVARR
ncbi:MAG: NAD(P)-dependent oxidoreductase [Phycisphaerales bacterium]|nr:NAD(P)-dependent oxidoreductase [Phycisphaerales bacterium]